MTKLKTYTADDILALREKLGMSQAQFWSRVEVSQSSGCHYELGRRIPRPVQVLIGFAYGTPCEAAEIVERLRHRRKLAKVQRKAA